MQLTVQQTKCRTVYLGMAKLIWDLQSLQCLFYGTRLVHMLIYSSFLDNIIYNNM